nr:immunoglobulin light chain junction region [Macaca mulatta]MOX85991.1 immunoglobulin light chain junction region [Macaca mulatta]MOX86614.1 immunoglobulin light chain junction region [Macaca mulatta]MOX87095.1 immunoglobulin light chain junction region [Macaca mulatta]MOX87218.1 immunoglobulin light chain junction region [Macaca mulatta]
CQQYSITPFTF